MNDTNDTGSTIAEDDLANDSLYAMLTPRERQVMQLLARGQSCEEIGKELGISTKTADTHRGKVIKKLQIENTAKLVHLALARGWVTLAHHVTPLGKAKLVEASALEWKT